MDVEKGDVSSGYGSMKSHTGLKHNGLESLMNDNDRIDADTNKTLSNGDVISGIGLLKSNILPQDNESKKLNEINMSVENGDVNGDYFYMNCFTGSDVKNHISIDYTKKRYGIYTNRYLRENNGLPDGVYIGDMLPASKLNQYVNIEYNNEHHNFQRNGNISTSYNSSVSTLTSTSVTLKNDKGCSLLITKYENTKFSYLSKTRPITIRSASGIIKSQTKILANKTWHYVVLEYVLKYTAMKEVVSEMDIIIIFSTQTIIRHNKCQMRFLDKVLLKQDFDKKIMINTITCSMLESPSTSDYYDTDNGVLNQ